jgi:glyoxylase-like metal-dependent hydrolase (beta-lactamase superfamily II)
MDISTSLPDSPPLVGAPVEVIGGIYLLRMPLPFRLNHINLYLLEDTQGWTLVDCGLNTPETIAIWENLFGTFFRYKPVTRIFVTHLHPDHIGLADWLHKKTGSPVLITGGEWGLANELFYLPETDPRVIKCHYMQLGFQGDVLEILVKQASGYKRMVKTLPQQVETVRGGQGLKIGSRCWEIRIGRGHSPECACLWNDQDKILIVGDHVLPKISPNINMLCVGPRNPLEEYLQSLDDFRDLSCKILLPAHGLPIRKFRERVVELQEHHHRQLNKLAISCVQPSTVADCMPYLFNAELPDHQLYFAAGETAAHLTYLAAKGRMKKEGDDLWKFQRQW